MYILTIIRDIRELDNTDLVDLLNNLSGESYSTVYFEGYGIVIYSSDGTEITEQDIIDYCNS